MSAGQLPSLCMMQSFPEGLFLFCSWENRPTENFLISVCECVSECLCVCVWLSPQRNPAGCQPAGNFSLYQQEWWLNSYPLQPVIYMRQAISDKASTSNGATCSVWKSRVSVSRVSYETAGPIWMNVWKCSILFLSFFNPSSMKGQRLLWPLTSVREVNHCKWSI